MEIIRAEPAGLSLTQDELFALAVFSIDAKFTADDCSPIGIQPGDGHDGDRA